MELDIELIQLWKSRIGKFVFVDYKTEDDSRIVQAYGKLKYVSDNGILTIESLKNKAESFDISVSSVVQAKVKEYIERGAENGK